MFSKVASYSIYWKYTNRIVPCSPRKQGGPSIIASTTPSAYVNSGTRRLFAISYMPYIWKYQKRTALRRFFQLWMLTKICFEYKTIIPIIVVLISAFNQPALWNAIGATKIPVPIIALMILVSAPIFLREFEMWLWGVRENLHELTKLDERPRGARMDCSHPF